MEQEVPVTIHEHGSTNPIQEPSSEGIIPEQIKAIGETLSEAFLSFKESESYGLLVKNTDKVKEYIQKKPAQALLYSLGTGVLAGLLLRKKR